jgi:hypothetical protein
MGRGGADLRTPAAQKATRAGGRNRLGSSRTAPVGAVFCGLLGAAYLMNLAASRTCSITSAGSGM